jgi:hypothetical protein
MRITSSFKQFLAAMAVGAVVGTVSCRAEDAAEAAAPEEGKEASAEVAAEKNFNPFTNLVRCQLANGNVEVRLPGGDWQAIRKGKYYPLGSSFRTRNQVEGIAGEAIIAFGPVSTVTLRGEAAITTKEIEIGAPSREMTVDYGNISISLPRTLKDGLFKVNTSAFEVFNMAGESIFTRTIDAAGDGDETVVRVVTGAIALNGRHYKIERMGAANQLRIRSTADELFTSLRGESGDFLIKLDQGVIHQIKDFETGEKVAVDVNLDFQMSPQCVIKIWRSKAEVGGRVVVSTMTFNANGDLVNRRVFAEKRTEVNSGELVIAPESESEAEKKVKDAETENTETIEAEEKKSEDSNSETVEE